MFPDLIEIEVPLMAKLTTCPECGRPLPFPALAIATTMTCPACRATFAADQEQIDPLPRPPDLPSVDNQQEAIRPRGASADRRRPAQEFTAQQPLDRDTDIQRDSTSSSFPAFVFQVQIKRDTAPSPFKGTVQARITPEGLILKPGKKGECFFPVGTRVRHVEGNLIRLTDVDRTLDLAVIGWRFRLEPLARDLAAFLDGRKRSTVRRSRQEASIGRRVSGTNKKANKLQCCVIRTPSAA